jgi:hypothetical protein
MCVSDCAEGKRLLEAAVWGIGSPEARDAFLNHIKNYPVCEAGGIQDCTDPENSN